MSQSRSNTAQSLTVITPTDPNTIIHFNHLPDELIKFVFNQLSVADQFNATFVCKNWRDFINNYGFGSTLFPTIKTLFTSSTWTKPASAICNTSKNSVLSICVLDLTEQNEKFSDSLLASPAYSLARKNLPVNMHQLDEYKSYAITTWLKMTTLTPEQIEAIRNDGLNLNKTIFLACINKITDVILYHEIAKQGDFFVLFVTPDLEVSQQIPNSILYKPEDLNNISNSSTNGYNAMSPIPDFYKHVIDKAIEIARLQTAATQRWTCTIV